MLIRATVIVLILVAGFLYMGLRLTGTLGLEGRWRAAVWAPLGIMLACILWFPAGFFLPVDLSGTAAEPLRNWMVFLSMGLALVLGLGLMVRDLGWAFWRGARRLLPRSSPAVADEISRTGTLPYSGTCSNPDYAYTLDSLLEELCRDDFASLERSLDICTS